MREPHTNNPLDALWQASVVIWVVLGGLALAVVLALAPGMDGDRLVYFGLMSLVIQWVVLLTLGSLYVLRRLLASVRPQRIAYVALALLLINTWLVSGVAWWLMRDIWPMTQDGWHALFLRLTGIVLAVGLLGLAAFQNHWRARQLAVRAKQAELEALQARIRPHFLFNTLNTGASLVHQRPGEAERLLLDLGDLFRAALAGPRTIDLADELSLARRYLEIEALRFAERLHVEWQLPDRLPAIGVPALSIQPLVENAIRHGVERTAAGGLIQIAVRDTGDTVTITVSNPLPERGAGSGTQQGHRVGLSSAQARIEALTGGRGRLEVAEVGGRYVATVVLPAAAAGIT